MLTIIAQLWYKLALLLTITLVVPMYIVPDTRQSDLLAYAIDNDDGKIPLILYDAHRRLGVQALDDIDFFIFELSVDGRIAFSSDRDGDIDVYVWDMNSVNAAPVNISQNPNTRDYPLSWSPDGRYLAFSSQIDRENTLLYVWNGKKSIDIMPDEIGSTFEGYEPAWSLDGRLAFSLGSNLKDTSQPQQIYLWNGSTTVNLSPNPAASDTSPAWDVDGKLAFASWQNQEIDIFVWDGVSVKNGSPDVDSFMIVPSELTGNSSPVWTNGGFLAFEASDPQDGYYSTTQIYVWDGQKTRNISDNPGFFNNDAQWSGNGNWAFISSPNYSAQIVLNVRDANNHTLFSTEAQNVPAWGSEGDLIFCRYGWSLLMWDGQETTEIANGWHVRAQWQGGSGVYCSGR